MSNKPIKAGSNQGRSFVPMVVLTASGFVSWRCFVFKPASNRFKNRRAAPAGSYYPIVVKKTSSVSESKKIRPVLTYKTLHGSIVNKEINKPWYRFILSGGSI
jgi:hypothetical protein